MCCNRSLNRKANHLGERRFQSFTSIRSPALIKYLIHHQIVQKLAMEMFQFVKVGNPEILNEIFRVRNEGFYELRQRTFFHIPSKNTVSSDLKLEDFPAYDCSQFQNSIKEMETKIMSV